MNTPITPPASPTPTGAPAPQPSPKATVDTAKKYIRTLEGDMEAIKKGIVPNLSPLKAPATTIPATPATPVLHPSPEATEDKAAPIPAPAQIPVPIQNPVKSYSSDFTQKMKETRASTATVLAAEQDAGKSGVPQDQPEKSHRSNILYIIAGVALLIFGIAGSYIAYSRYLASAEPVILAPAVYSPIFADEKEKISGTSPDEIMQAIKQSLTRSLAPNTVRFLYTDFATTTGKSVFSALQLPAPGALLRNINASRSMVGIVSAGGSQNPFFILSVASYGGTFAGMLSWEPAMIRDLSELFPSFAGGFGGQASSTIMAASTDSTDSPRATAASTPILTTSFYDEVVNNHDVRIYRDAEGRSVLLYGYWNQTTLVIARDTEAFTELIRRLATTRLPAQAGTQ